MRLRPRAMKTAPAQKWFAGAQQLDCNAPCSVCNGPLASARMSRKFLIPILAAAITTIPAFGGFVEDWAKLLKAVPEGYVCARALDEIVIDGRLDERSWVAAPWTREFQDIEGPAKPAPRFQTRAKMLWDKNYFYIAAEMLEPHVWGVITNHDAVIFHDPDFEVFIDPDGDRHNYYEFEMNALNTGWDLILKKPYIDGGPALNEWEIPGLKTGVHIRGTLNQPTDLDEAWFIEIAIPWKVLGEFSKQKTPPGEGDIWRVDFSRVEWQVEIIDGKYRKVPGTREDNWVWSPTGIIDMHRPENWGFVKFVDKSANERFSVARDADRDALLAVYYMQKDYKAKNNIWAASLKALLDAFPSNSDFSKMDLRKTAAGYVASVGKYQIREDGLLSSRD